MLEFDLIGRKIMLSDGDARLLLDAAEAASGSSIGSRDLATRLKDMASSQARRRIVFSRPESRALQRMIQSQIEPSEQLQELRAMLSELLSTDTPAG